MVKDKRGIVLAVCAFSVYIAGGLGVFAGVGLYWLMEGQNLWGWGDGRTVGYLFFFVGLSLSILGVLLMRIFRNRGFA